MDELLTLSLSLTDVLSFGGAVVVAVIVGLWAKHALADWRWTPWVVLAGTVAVMVVIQLIVAEWRATSADIAKAVLLAVLGATLETWGYEAVVNALGAAGIGRRSEEALLERAQTTVDAAALDQ